VRVLFDLGHPAHFHLFRNAIAELRDCGHGVEIVAHEKDCLPDLLRAAGWAHHLIPRRSHRLGALPEAALRALAVELRLAGREPIDLMVGTSISIGLASRLGAATSIVFEEDDATVIPVFAKLAYGSSHYVATPRCLAFEKHGSKHLTYPGYHELAYLHPDRFRPNEGIRRELGLPAGERYFVVRLVAFRAHHDVGQRGLGLAEAREIVRRLGERGRVFLSGEGELAEDLEPYRLPTPPDRIFDVLAGADIVVGDSQTMIAEAAVLGTPALRCNTFVGRLAYLEELEHEYGLTVGVRPDRFDRALALIDAWLAEPNLRAEWQRRRQAMLARTVDLTTWMLDVFGRLAARRSAGRGTVPAR